MKILSSLKLLCSLISLLISLKQATSLDSVTSEQPLRDNETLVSSNEVFELGFFSPGNPSKRFLGIWYKKTPRRVFWVANREKPITDSPATLVIGENGNLALLDRNSSTTWFTSISIAHPENVVLQLLSSGNLVLRERTSSSHLWQSFDHPCDTLFPGMKISWNLESRQELFLTSWKSLDDPSRGDKSYRFENKTLPQLALFAGSIKKFRTGPWNGLQFAGSSAPISKVVTRITKFDGQEWSFGFEQNDEFFATVMTITPSGLLETLVLNDENSTEWTSMYAVPKVPCNNYGYCGMNAICRSSSNPLCDCLHGFVSNSSPEGNEYNRMRGCKRRVNLECGAGDRFSPLVGVKLPDLLEYRVKTSMTLEQCKSECLRNCSCTAYTNSDVREGGSGCMMWYGNLLDMIEYEQQDADQDVYLRLAASEFESESKPEKKRVGVAKILVPVTFAVSFLSLSIWFIYWKRKISRKGTGTETEDIDLPIYSSDTISKEDVDLPIFSLATIADATWNFSSLNFIGKGGFGSVYKGILPTGQEVAVKRRSVDSGQGIEEFKNEVFMLAKLQHRNLVALLGCCIHGAERMLVYEYMSNKSLDRFIFGHNQSASLNWETRYNIILGIARGLLYLHQDSKLQIIHRDLKASNILLDSDMNPKISDFGLARIFNGGENEKNTKKVVGTYGYMSPEYAVDGKFSVKSDVFSFGVVLLEVLSGRRNRGFSTPEHHHNLLGHAWMLWNEGEAMELIDPSSKATSNMESQVLRCIQVGLLCVQKFPRDRPTMVSVVLMLSNDEINIPSPKEPSFFVERSVVGEDLVSPDDVSGARYETTVTMFEGR